MGFQELKIDIISGLKREIAEYEAITRETHPHLFGAAGRLDSVSARPLHEALQDAEEAETSEQLIGIINNVDWGAFSPCCAEGN
jgi:hypothetical protein